MVRGQAVEEEVEEEEEKEEGRAVDRVQGGWSQPRSHPPPPPLPRGGPRTWRPSPPSRPGESQAVLPPAGGGGGGARSGGRARSIPARGDGPPPPPRAPAAAPAHARGTRRGDELEEEGPLRQGRGLGGTGGRGRGEGVDSSSPPPCPPVSAPTFLPLHLLRPRPASPPTGSPGRRRGPGPDGGRGGAVGGACG